MFDEPLRNFHRESVKKTFDFRALHDERLAAAAETRRVARGIHINRMRAREFYCGVVTEIEGAPGGPWYLRFECVPKAWYDQVFVELDNVDFGLAGLPEAGHAGTLRAADIFRRFLNGGSFDAALARATPEVRWQVAILRRWFTERCVGGADGGQTLPDTCMFEIQYNAAQLGRSAGLGVTGTWCQMTLVPPQNPARWDFQDGWLVRVADPELKPQPHEALKLEPLAEPWQSRLTTLNYPFPEGLEIEIEEGEP
jgi:hypothetical protein